MGRSTPTGPGLTRAQRESPQTPVAGDRSDRLLHRLPVGLVVVDRRYDIQTINNAARRLFGIPSLAVGEDLIHLTQTLPPGSLRSAIDTAFRRGEAVTLAEVELTELALGETRFLQIACYPHRSDGESGPFDVVMILVTEVTAQVQLRRELEQARARQQLETERLSERLERLVEANRELVEANQELAVMHADLRSANEELLVANEESQAATEEIETLNEELQASNEELETLNEELQATVEELNTTNDDLQARSLELQELTTSLEAQRQASEAERAQLAAILVSMGDAVLVVDRAGQPVLANQAYERMFGRFGSPTSDFVPEDDDGRPLAPETTPRQRAARGESFRLEFTLTASDGSRRWYEANGQPIRTGQTLQGGVVVVRDITERSLRRLQDEFLALASHELRTPLTVLGGYLDMLLRSLPPDADASLRRYAETARSQTRRLAELSSELLDVARLQSGKMRFAFAPVDLSSLVSRVAEMAHSLTQGQAIQVEAEAEPLIITGDAGRLEQVLFNLLTNAINHAPNTERIEVRLGRLESEVEIQVRDYGTGIPADDLTSIFSRFYQATHNDRPVRGGLGLGLYITREIIAAHGGTIEASSEEGSGTTFTIRLPLAP